MPCVWVANRGHSGKLIRTTMSAFECQETLFQLFAIEKVIQALVRRDPALLNHDRHVSIAIARLASNVVRNPESRCIDYPYWCHDAVRRPGDYVCLFNGQIAPARMTAGSPEITCQACHVVLTFCAEAYPVPAASPRHWMAVCTNVHRSLCRPCHELNCRCGKPATPGLLYAKASYEQ